MGTAGVRTEDGEGIRESSCIAARLTRNGPLLDEDCEDGQDGNGLNGGCPEVVDVSHAIEALDNVTGNEADAVSRLLLGDAWLRGTRWKENQDQQLGGPKE